MEQPKKLNDYMKKNNLKDISFLYNNAYEFEGKIIAGTRGWILISKEEEDKKIVNRELLRLELSITEGIKNMEKTKRL